MTRLEALKVKSSTLPYSRIIARLSESEFDTVVAFIEDNDQLGHLEFEYAVNRMHLNVEEKPKKWAIIQEVLTVVNTMVHGKVRR
jgi:hypothetical protein